MAPTARRSRTTWRSCRCPGSVRTRAVALAPGNGGITANAASGDATWRFLSYLLQPAQELQLTRADGALPATLDAIRQSPDFAPGGPEHIYVQQLQNGTAAFSSAVLNIVRGHDVRQALDTAVRQIDGNLAANGVYEPSEP
jgi:multiple sugar transport system substrate-binding protein